MIFQLGHGYQRESSLKSPELFQTSTVTVEASSNLCIFLKQTIKQSCPLHTAMVRWRYFQSFNFSLKQLQSLFTSYVKNNNTNALEERLPKITMYAEFMDRKKRHWDRKGRNCDNRFLPCFKNHPCQPTYSAVYFFFLVHRGLKNGNTHKFH